MAIENHDTDDRELVRRVLAGESEWFRVIVDRHERSIFRFAFGLLRNREDAHDLSQETFLTAYVNLAVFDHTRAAFSTWLFTIARNRCINWLKRHRPVAVDMLDLASESASPDPFLAQELTRQLDHALAALPIEQRSAFVLAEIEELPYAEIARIEGTSLGTVKSRIFRAKQKLQSLLDPETGERK